MENQFRFLLECSGKPNPEMELFDIANLIQPVPYEDKYENIDLVNESLISGTGLSQQCLQKACEILSKAIDKPNVLFAFQLLDYSYSQFYGFMGGSYYNAHYRHDRKKMSRYNLDKSYLEIRIAYDTAFLTAFRGIEAILEKTNFRKNDITNLLIKADSKYGTNFSTKKHKSFHEIFSSRKRLWYYEEIIRYYLKMRNAVAAHGNINPPQIIMEDQVFEIQLLLKNMFIRILHPEN